MKAFKHLVIFGLAFSFQNSFGLSLNDYIRADISLAAVDAGSPLAEVQIQTAEVNYNTSQDLLSLTIQVVGSDCAPDSFCPAVLPEPIVITLPKTEQYTDACGRTTYVAASEDGDVNQAILFTDNAHAQCGEVESQSLYEVEYQVQNKLTGETATAIFVTADEADHVGLPVVPPAAL